MRKLGLVSNGIILWKNNGKNDHVRKKVKMVKGLDIKIEFHGRRREPPISV